MTKPHETDRISVIIPSFNAARFLPLAVRSVVEQSVPGVEVVIVDDASTDDTAAAVRELSQSHKQIRYFSQVKNAGPGRSRTIGLKQARGRYVCFLDADDEYGPGVFSACLSTFREYERANIPVLAVKFAVKIIELPSGTHVAPEQLRKLSSALPSNIMVNRNFCRALGGFPDDPRFRTSVAGEDVAFRAAVERWGVTAANETVALHHRYRGGSHLEQYLRGTNSPYDGDTAIQALEDHKRAVHRRMVDLLSGARAR